MTWMVHEWGVDPQLDEIISRRFGPNHDKPCERPEILMCSLWECQRRNQCQYTKLKLEK